MIGRAAIDSTPRSSCNLRGKDRAYADGSRLKVLRLPVPLRP
jgi:hypothetical protein